MEAIRKIEKINSNQIIINLPEGFKGKVVEVIIFPVEYTYENEADDTEYLSGIPGMVDSIKDESNRPLGEYSKIVDW